jgi:hypothetical protein
MRASTAADLVGAAMPSALTFPFIGMALRNERRPSRTRTPWRHL